MRYSDNRPVLLKGIDQRDWDNPSTPRWLSPYPGKSGYVIAALREVGDLIPLPKPRAKKRKPRQRVRGVALKVKPWSVQDGS